MDWLLNEIYILGGVSLGLFLAICLYGYKKMCLGAKDAKKQSCPDDSFEIEEWKSEIDDDQSYRLSIGSSRYFETTDEQYLAPKKEKNIPINLLANVLNDLTEKLDQTKEMEEIIKAHGRKIKKLSKVNKALEKRIGNLEGHMANSDPLSRHAPMNGIGLENIGRSFCACKPGDKVACFDSVA